MVEPEALATNFMTEGGFYDLEDVLPRSPQLEPINPNLKPAPTPPPVLVSSSSSSSSESEESDIDPAREPARDPAAKRLKKRKKGRKKRKHVPSQGDTVLISYLDQIDQILRNKPA